MTRLCVIHVITAIVASITIVAAALVADGASHKMSPRLQAQVQQAMQLTMSGSGNITQAHDACRLWNNVLSNKENDMPPPIRAICHGLQASCLTRVGQDTIAIEAYDASLDLEQFLTSEALQDVVMGKGFALQRLMRYDEARHLFLKRPSVEKAVCAAATCALRLQDVHWALKVLEEYCCRPDAQCSYQALGMLGTLLYLEDGNRSLDSDAALFLQKSAAASPLYAWIYHALLRQNSHSSKQLRDESGDSSNNDYLQLAEVNQSPFDDPALIQLDDKVMLHQLLTNSTVDKEHIEAFWPKGFVLPQEAAYLKDFVERKSVEGLVNTAKTWMLKQRAGYGSHGNKLVSSIEAMQYCSNVERSESCLCQQVIDPPLLIRGRKFSIRVYVVYFMKYAGTTSDNVYISTSGLVKLASVLYSHDHNDDNRVHMTNSGREDTMLQHDLVFLKQEFDQAEWSYTDFWSGICTSVRTVMRTYTSATASSQTLYQSKLANLGVPKLLGFDFMVDTELKPWLLEVNRFPGLEARDENDEVVKRKVVRDAWRLATERLGGVDDKHTTILQHLPHDVNSPTSLDPITL